MAEALIKYETLDENQINDIMNDKEPRPPEDWDQGDDSSDDDKKKECNDGCAKADKKDKKKKKVKNACKQKPTNNYS